MTGQDRAVLGPHQIERDRGFILDLHTRPASGQCLEPVRGFQFVGVVGVQLFDMQVLIIKIGCGDTPAKIV